MTARMHELEPLRIKRLLDRMLTARARRDAEPRWSARWHELDAELHRIERAVFHAPIEDDDADRRLNRAG